MAFDLWPTEEVLPWPGNANMAFDLWPTEDVLLWPGNANMAFDLWARGGVVVPRLHSWVSNGSRYDKRANATKLYCFVHKVPVCGECICFTEHQNCVVRTYSEWVIDGEYDWPNKCCQCQAVLEEGGGDAQTTRLGCLHIIHTSCLVTHIKSYPPHTAPAGYVCPTCSTSIALKTCLKWELVIHLKISMLSSSAIEDEKEAMQEELLQFKLQQLQEYGMETLPNDCWAMGLIEEDRSRQGVSRSIKGDKFLMYKFRLMTLYWLIQNNGASSAYLRSLYKEMFKMEFYGRTYFLLGRITGNIEGTMEYVDQEIVRRKCGLPHLTMKLICGCARLLVESTLDSKSMLDYGYKFMNTMIHIFLQKVLMLGKVGDEAVHKELGDRMEKAATTASSLEAEQESDVEQTLRLRSGDIIDTSGYEDNFEATGSHGISVPHMSKKVDAGGLILKQNKKTYHALFTKMRNGCEEVRSVTENWIGMPGISLVPPHAVDQGRFDETQM
ncbi:zinc finger protein-like protein 1 [Tanacetum coccineum]